MQAFKSFFGGIYISPSTNPNIGEGAIYKLNKTGISLHLSFSTTNGTDNQYDTDLVYTIENEQNIFARFTHNYTNAEVNTVFSDSTSGQNAYYIQGLAGAYGKVEFPTLQKWFNNDTINYLITGFEFTIYVADNSTFILPDQLFLTYTSSAGLRTYKSAMLNYLEKKNINIGKWSILNSNKEMNNIAKIMGYPKKKIVLKPSIGSGSRGVIILDSKIKKFKYLLTNRFCGTGNISCVIKEIKKFKINLKKYICMPHYSGDVYDLDCFAINGKPITVIPRLRVYENPLSPTNQGCIIKKNLKVINYTKKIIRALNLNGPCDFDIVLDRDRKPKLLDSSNRMSGSVGASFVGDLNLPEQIVRHLSGLRLNKIKINKEKHMFPVNKFIKL